jgi:hypothetical protein
MGRRCGGHHVCRVRVVARTRAPRRGAPRRVRSPIRRSNRVHDWLRGSRLERRPTRRFRRSRVCAWRPARTWCVAGSVRESSLECRRRPALATQGPATQLRRLVDPRALMRSHHCRADERLLAVLLVSHRSYSDHNPRAVLDRSGLSAPAAETTSSCRVPQTGFASDAIEG